MFWVLWPLLSLFLFVRKPRSSLYPSCTMAHIEFWDMQENSSPWRLVLGGTRLLLTFPSCPRPCPGSSADTLTWQASQSLSPVLAFGSPFCSCSGSCRECDNCSCSPESSIVPGCFIYSSFDTIFSSLTSERCWGELCGSPECCLPLHGFLRSAVPCLQFHVIYLYVIQLNLYHVSLFIKVNILHCSWLLTSYYKLASIFTNKQKHFIIKLNYFQKNS